MSQGRCIYCRHALETPVLTHLLPRFLGGGYTPERFRTREVCAPCQAQLGLFVDSGFEKHGSVGAWLRESGRYFYDTQRPMGLPLMYTGAAPFSAPGMNPELESCELWMGALGEHVFWVRPKDNLFHAFSGRVPDSVRMPESRAYFVFSEKTRENPMMSWLAFRDAMDGRRVKKIMCSAVTGHDPTKIGFETPDELDNQRITYFRQMSESLPAPPDNISLKSRFDERFMARLGIGVAFALFGWRALQTSYAEELYRALWFRRGEPPSKMKGNPFHEEGNGVADSGMAGEEHAVTLAIMPTREGVAATLNLSATLHATVLCASGENLKASDKKMLGHGRVLILYRSLRRALYMSLPEYVAHKCGVHEHTGLTEVAQKAAIAREYFNRS